MHNFRNTLLLLLLCSSPLNCASDSKVDVLQGQERDFLDLTEWEFGEDIDDPVQQIGVIQSPRSDDAAIYAIAVGTFSGPGHQQSARQYLESLANQYPGVAGRLTVRERSRGSVLAFGSYKGYDDSAAKKDIEIFLLLLPVVDISFNISLFKYTSKVSEFTLNSGLIYLPLSV